MTTKIIYHDFRQSPAPASIPEKGRRILRAARKVNTALNDACLFLCGACAAVSVMILVQFAFL